jgi:colanic acid/amylovoran biosynthesis protein
LGALVSASKAGVIPMLRDPVSAARAREQGVQNVRDAADIVFSAKTVDLGILDRLGISEDARRNLVLVNVSGLIARSLDQVGEYEVIINHLRAAGRTVILLPHVSRPLADDAIACAAVYERVGKDHVTLVHGLLAPAEIRGLASAAEIVITGRMHLSIMTLWNSKPAITLTTQGKVEGLMEMFESRALCVEPQAGFSATVVAVINELLSDDNATVERVTRLLPKAKQLANQNFDGLPDLEAATK